VPSPLVTRAVKLRVRYTCWKEVCLRQEVNPGLPMTCDVLLDAPKHSRQLLNLTPHRVMRV
jgi:hypothetical protein